MKYILLVIVMLFNFNLKGQTNPTDTIIIEWGGFPLTLSLLPGDKLKCKAVLFNPETNKRLKLKFILHKSEKDKFYQEIKKCSQSGFTIIKKISIKPKFKIRLRFRSKVLKLNNQT